MPLTPDEPEKESVDGECGRCDGGPRRTPSCCTMTSTTVKSEQCNCTYDRGDYGTEKKWRKMRWLRTELDRAHGIA